MKKINETTKANLFSTDTKTVISAINSIKQKGNKLYIPLLFELLKSNPEKEIEDEIKMLLACVKDKETIPVFVSAFEDEKFRPIWKTILTTCWQNGLDFKDDMLLFLELVINEDWEIAFEAFTILDNLQFLPDKNTIEQAKKRIHLALESANEQKAYLLNEIASKY